MVVNLGGFVPRRWAQFSKDPVWALLAFTGGYWLAEYAFISLKLNNPALVYDPHRYIYNASHEKH